jgi:hypothetical protein
LIGALRVKWSAPLLSILRHGDSPIPEDDYSVDSNDGPNALLKAVQTALEWSKTSHGNGGCAAVLVIQFIQFIQFIQDKRGSHAP